MLDGSMHSAILAPVLRLLCSRIRSRPEISDHGFLDAMSREKDGVVSKARLRSMKHWPSFANATGSERRNARNVSSGAHPKSTS